MKDQSNTKNGRVINMIDTTKLTNNKLEVIEINDSRKLSEALGITDERQEKLHNLIGESIKPKGKITDTFQLISKECLHANELMYCGFVLGRFLLGERASEGGGLLGLLQILRNPGE